MGRLADGGSKRDRFVRRADPSITRILAHHGVDGVKHRDVDDGHRPAGTARTELLPKQAVLTGRGRGVVEAAGIDRDFVPAANCVETSPWPLPGTGINLGSGPAGKSVGLLASLRGARPEGRKGQGEDADRGGGHVREVSCDYERKSFVKLDLYQVHSHISRRIGSEKYGLDFPT